MKKLFKTTLIVLFVGFFSGCNSSSGLVTLNQMIVFGDGNSDGGTGANGIFVLTQGANPLSPPYFDGRFTNGLLWADWLYGFLAIDYVPAQNNFAVGGATAGAANILTGQANGMLAQVQAYLAANPNLSDNALFVLWAGGNNFLVPGIDPNTVIPQAIGEVQQCITLLIGAGAKYIVVANVPSDGRAPFAQPLGLRDALDFLSFTFDEALAALVGSLSPQFPDVTIFLVNTFEVQFGAILIPQLFGFTNVTDPCLFNGQICATPDQYLYWDEKNFSRIFHQGLALQFLNTICADPIRFSNCQYKDQINNSF